MIFATEKIKEYLELAGISQGEFAEKIGFDNATVSLVLNQKEEPSKKFIEEVISRTGLKFESAFEVRHKRKEDK